jgi:uncharacterized protein YndB with AHSA1/START domain
VAKFRISQTINAPPARVFDVFTDFAHAAQRIPAITKLELLSDGSVRKGTRFRETRVVFKQQATQELEIAAFEPPRAYAVSCTTGGVRYVTTFTFAAAGGGTEVVVEMQTEALTAMAKLMSPATSMMLGGMISKCLTDDVQAIKTFIETGKSAKA